MPKTHLFGVRSHRKHIAVAQQVLILKTTIVISPDQIVFLVTRGRYLTKEVKVHQASAVEGRLIDV
jgi:hypothetical protein